MILGIGSDISDARRVVDRLPRPFRGVAIGRIDAALRLAIRLEIREHEKRIAVVHERAVQLRERPALARRLIFSWPPSGRKLALVLAWGTWRRGHGPN